jgi:Spy/CpxP family protein refolding chaperone
MESRGVAFLSTSLSTTLGFPKDFSPGDTSPPPLSPSQERLGRKGFPPLEIQENRKRFRQAASRNTTPPVIDFVLATIRGEKKDWHPFRDGRRPIRYKACSTAWRYSGFAAGERKGDGAMKKAMIAAAMATAMLIGTGHVYAQGGGCGHEGKGMHSQGHSGHSKELSLTPEQKTKVQELHQNFIKENAQLIGSLVTKRLELRSLWTDPKADDQAIMAKEKELSALKAQMKDKVFQMKLAFRKILTPEQLTSWRWGEGMGHKGMMGGHGMGGHHEMMPGRSM